jgi:1-acyl-sn-glycerol-3-phosphate acyltransferase
MNPVVSDKPYIPVPPYHGTLWPRILNRFVTPLLLRRGYGITKITVNDAGKLRASISAGHGILITPNHARDEDPFVLSALAKEVGHPFFVIASAHLFIGSPIQSFLLRRAGAFSIYREGMDKQAVQTSIEILESAERPLVIFPEGHISRTNDRLTPMLEGTSLIARQAAKKRAKDDATKQVVVHPVAIRYAFSFDIPAAVTKVLDQIETRLTWRPSRSLPLPDRLAKVGAGLLALKELEYLGHTQPGTIHDRITSLISALLAPLETEFAADHHDGHPVARVKRLRSAILPDLVKGDLPDPEK